MARNIRRPTLLSVFTGAGGLDIGLEAAGFSNSLCIELDTSARETLAKNRPGWKLSLPGDIHKLKPHEILRQAGLKKGELDLLAGGPPCQPFSKSANWADVGNRRLRDPRARTLHAYMRLVEAALPRVLLIENVSGITFAGKDEGIKMLRRRIRAINRRKGTNYELRVLHLNLADFGIPQSRERVFLIASIDGSEFLPPAVTHGVGPNLKPFVTAWDVLGDLDTKDWPPSLNLTGRWARLLPSIPEGQNYLWHTPRNSALGGEPLFGWRTRYWSFLLKLAKNRPAWTVQANPGPATGPFHWKNRRLSIRELCRLQTFPNSYRIQGADDSARRQIGNAVPCAIGEIIGLEIRRQLFNMPAKESAKLIPSRRRKCPSPERPRSVPKDYLVLRGKHDDHPGSGLGPGVPRLRLFVAAK